MTPIRPYDLVRLRETPRCSGVVMGQAIYDDQVLVLVDFRYSEIDAVSWLPLELLELVLGQFERLAA